MTTAVAPRPAEPSLSELAKAAKSDRNRAVDLYRVVAMVAVAIGHWVAISIGLNSAGGLTAGNALAEDPSMSWVTWLFQVMPLFFVVGGFSSAMSLDSHNAKGGRPQDWIVARLRRMLAPAVVLAGTWLAILGIANVAGVGGLAAAGAVGAAIPLWFLSNYTIDTALAPYVLPRFRRNPAKVGAFAVAVFLTLEGLRMAGVPVLPQLNWVLGWLMFQVAGFAWKDGLLPTGARLATIAAGLWTAAIAAVAFGPWPVSMVHFEGLEMSPTHPPSLALMLFGAAYSATALVFAPAVSAWLARAPRVWAGVVGANSVAMSVYLWHMTAAVAACAVFYAFGWLPTAAVGTAAWWIQKLPIIASSAVVLAAIVAVVSTHERKALLAERRPWNGGQASMMALAAVISASIKLWAGGHTAVLAISCATVVGIWVGILNRPGTDKLGRIARVTSGR